MYFPDYYYEEDYYYVSDEDSEPHYDSPSDYDYEFDEDDHIQEHEMFLYEYSPEYKEVEDLTGLDVLKLSDMTIKLVEAIKLRLGGESRWIILFLKAYK